jgi:regulator of sigma E protease
MLEVTLTPREDPPPGQGAMGIIIRPAYHAAARGVIYIEGGDQQALIPLSFGESLQYGLSRITGFLGALIRLPSDLISGVVSPEEARFISPLGISQIGGVFLQRSIEQDRPVIILEYIAIISIALGITNLLPLPMLDGGRIVFVLIEIVRGRPIAPEREGMVHLVGMALLLSLIVLTFLNDIINPVTNLLP